MIEHIQKRLKEVTTEYHQKNNGQCSCGCEADTVVWLRGRRDGLFEALELLQKVKE